MAAFALAIDIPEENPYLVALKGLNDTFCPQCVNPLAKDLRNKLKKARIECENVSDAVFAFLVDKQRVPIIGDTVLGEGKFGKVYEGTLGDQEVAIKRISNNTSIQTLVELSIMAKLSSPYIVAFKGFHVDSNMNIIMESMTGGDLFDFFNTSLTQKPHMNTVLKILCDTARAIKCLHKQTPPIVHRDIKIENILLDAEGNAKLTDFGTATFYLDDGNRITRSVNKAGTEQYLPPRDAEVSPALDMYAFGVVCVMMLATLKAMSNEEFTAFEKYYDSKDTISLLGMVKNVGCSVELISSIEKCLNPDAARRPRASDMVKELSEELLSLNEEDAAVGVASELPSVAAEEAVADQPSISALEEAVEEQFKRAGKRSRSEL